MCGISFPVKSLSAASSFLTLAGLVFFCFFPSAPIETARIRQQPTAKNIEVRWRILNIMAFLLRLLFGFGGGGSLQLERQRIAHLLPLAFHAIAAGRQRAFEFSADSLPFQKDFRRLESGAGRREFSPSLIDAGERSRIRTVGRAPHLHDKPKLAVGNFERSF